MIFFTIRVSSPELLGIIDASQVPSNKATQVIQKRLAKAAHLLILTLGAGGIFMDYDPLAKVIDESLIVSKKTVEKLSAFKTDDKFCELPGENIFEEKERLSTLINSLIDRLNAGIVNNPSKLWVMSQFQPTLEIASDEDTEGREHFARHLEAIMDIFEIESSDGLLGFYLG